MFFSSFSGSTWIGCGSHYHTIWVMGTRLLVSLLLFVLFDQYLDPFPPVHSLNLCFPPQDMHELSHGPRFFFFFPSVFVPVVTTAREPKLDSPIDCASLLPRTAFLEPFYLHPSLLFGLKFCRPYLLNPFPPTFCCFCIDFRLGPPHIRLFHHCHHPTQM